MPDTNESPGSKLTEFSQAPIHNAIVGAFAKTLAQVGAPAEALAKEGIVSFVQHGSVCISTSFDPMKITGFISDLLWLVFPSLCAACGNPLYHGEHCLCTPCRFHLPKTGFHKFPDNPVARHFWGKVNIEAATAYYYFSKGEKIQRLIHQLKYKGRRDVGQFIGELTGADLLHSGLYGGIDAIVPVPLHPDKLRKRGYNQSDFFAEGIAASMGIKFYPDGLKKILATETQTRKHRFERYQNVDRVFEVNPAAGLSGKHVLLVDDVITTGSTLISCAEVLLELPGTRVSIAAMACA